MLSSIQPAPPDPILGLTDAFKADSTPEKVNLGVGVYKDEELNTPVLRSVKEAEKRILASLSSKAYLPISGSQEYGRRVQEMVFGLGSGAPGSERVRTLHCPGGTGALRVGAEFLKEFAPTSRVWVSNPTWANHKGIFSAAGMEVTPYAYYAPQIRALDWDNLKASLAAIPRGDIVVMHVCCHNPTGVDPSPGQWDEIVEIAARKGWVPYLDFAYQGFGRDVETDRYPVTRFLEAGIEFLVASSFSKNFGLYHDRTGALTVVAINERDAEAAFSPLKKTVRVIYSNPPAHGGLIVEQILGSPELREEWLDELAGMRDRIREMRKALVEGLSKAGVDQDFAFIEKQRGMFSFSGLTDSQVNYLRTEKGIYMVGGGRMNVAGITWNNVGYLCTSIAEALKKA